MSEHAGRGHAIFVMDARGNLYASNFHEAGVFHHSSLVAGEPVAAAGEIVVENGVLQSITRTSGHYRPSEQLLDQALVQLERFGVRPKHIKKQSF